MEIGGYKMAIHIVFVEPEIPPNTGNIARTCAATDSVLHLVKPLGFDIDDKNFWQIGINEVKKLVDEFLEISKD